MYDLTTVRYDVLVGAGENFLLLSKDGLQSRGELFQAVDNDFIVVDKKRRGCNLIHQISAVPWTLRDVGHDPAAQSCENRNVRIGVAGLVDAVVRFIFVIQQY